MGPRKRAEAGLKDGWRGVSPPHPRASYTHPFPCPNRRLRAGPRGSSCILLALRVRLWRLNGIAKSQNLLIMRTPSARYVVSFAIFAVLLTLVPRVDRPNTAYDESARPVFLDLDACSHSLELSKLAIHATLVQRSVIPIGPSPEPEMLALRSPGVHPISPIDVLNPLRC